MACFGWMQAVSSEEQDSYIAAKHIYKAGKGNKLIVFSSIPYYLCGDLIVVTFKYCQMSLRPTAASSFEH
jgi:hypothetical protein